jgi:hypothetical protein
VKALVRAVRFFLVVPPLPRLMLYAFIGVTGVSAAAIALDPHRAKGAAVPLLALQVFATSTGFAAHARRGHYDLLLAGGIGRTRTAVVQWLLAAAPGVVCLGVLAAAEQAFAGTATTRASGTLAAALIVTTVPWAITVSLPRFSGAIGWLLLVVVVRSLETPGDWWHLAWRDAPDGGSMAAFSLLVFPVGAAGANLGDAEPVLMGVAVASAFVSMALALRWIRRAPIALDTGQ